jgi:quercetin dioxygenase-like cupin family protein
MNLDGSDDGVIVQHHYYGNVYAKEVHINAGKTLVGHKHIYDHLSILAAGSVLVEVDDVPTIHKGPTSVHIAAGKSHQVTALENSLWYCIHAVAFDLGEHQDASLIST